MPRQTQHDDRAGAPAGHILEEVEQAFVGPVDVLLDEHERGLPRQELEVAAPRVEQLVARQAARAAQAEDGAQRCGHPLR